jgi:tetratricopeptide (TPR) repeat protein
MSSLHQRAKNIFLVALAQPASERDTFLAGACGDDAALRREVESLLAFHEGTDNRAAADEPKDGSFAPGDLFAGRYRMVARIGRGGMGDVWQADDLVLDTPVALKVIYSTAPERRERILNEVRLARQITHPAICRVFDVGETKGDIFYSMEFVKGEDLAALLRRVGRLPVEKVVDIGLQLSSGLAAAHAVGVLHRDLKPANVLIDNDGLVRITDFGIAIPTGSAGQHTLTGTPAYLAPEQRAPGATLSERTDVYALGMVLYELITGQHAATANGLASPPPPSTFVPNLDPRLDALVMRALSPEPEKRPASALEIADALAGLHRDRAHATHATTRIQLPSYSSRTVWTAAGAAALVIAVVLAAIFFRLPGSQPLTAQDSIVLAEFENTTGDPAFDGALKVALAVALEQSPFLKVFPEDRARETLRLMQRSHDEKITRALAREIARREEIKALLAGSISSLGRNYVLALEAINAVTGDVMARQQAEASSKEEVLTALGEATSKLREKLGESLSSIQKFDVPLARATTPSLEALHAYSLALYDGREVPRLEAIPHLKRAIELDPTFAMAHALLSAVYANTGQSALAPEYARKAFELRDRVSERERFFISWRYYRDAIQAWDRGLDLARSWTVTYPREAFAFNSLGSALIRLGDFEQSVQAFREAIRLDPKFIPAYANLSASLLALNRPDEARSILKQAEEKRLEFIGARRLSYLIAFVQGDRATMDRELEASIGVRETNSAFGWQAHASAFDGRIQAAHEQFRRGFQLSLQGSFREVAADLALEDAETHAIVGQCDVAMAEVPQGLELARGNLVLERASRVMALCGAPAEATSLSNEIERRFPEATLTVRVALPVTAAALALERGDAARAVELLEPVRPYDHAPSGEFWALYLRGQAFLRQQQGAAAAGEFESILTHRGEVPTSIFYPLAHLGRARAASLSGDTARARKEYEAMFQLWAGADPELLPLKQARAEHAKLEQ